MLLRLPGSKGSLGIGRENKRLLEQSDGATGILRTKFRSYTWTGKQSNTSCIGQKVMLWERDAEPRKRKFEVSSSPVSLLFFFSPGSLGLFLLMEVLWAVLFLSLYNFCACFVSIPLSSVIPPLSSSPSLLVLSLCLLLLRSHVWL